jgi:hypothetical protein
MTRALQPRAFMAHGPRCHGVAFPLRPLKTRLATGDAAREVGQIARENSGPR